MEERKLAHKILLLLVRTLPALFAFLALLNTILSYFDIDLVILTYLGGVSVGTLILLYHLSYIFHFCLYHRLFIHYITLTFILNIIDYHWGIPVSDKGLFMIYMVIAGLFLFVILYLHMRELKKRKTRLT